MNAIYFIGAGGIGMSALERYFKASGYVVGGYDRTPSPLTDALIREGIDLHFSDDVSLIAPAFLDPAQCIVCYTPAVPADHSELRYFREHGFQVMKRSQLLGQVTRQSRGICVAGTHGKTTTSSMIAHLLKQSHIDCSAFLGGILKPYDSNLMLSTSSPYVVIEADEFDRSFHTLSPYMAVITSCDPDHLDIYGTEEAYREAFAHFTELIPPVPGSYLLKHRGVRVECRHDAGVDYGEYDVITDPAAESEPLPRFYATRVRIADGTIRFDFVADQGRVVIPDIELGVPAPINVLNATAALAIGYLLGCTPDELRRGIASFQGARRRFDFHIKRPDLVVVDDYAHHPDEVSASLASLRQLFPGRHITLCFQPHLFSRTRDLAPGFAAALAIPDRTILLPIYPAREQPIPGITSEWLLDQIDSSDKALCAIDQLVPHLEQLRREGQLDVVVMMGAGVDIERLVAPAAQALAQL